MPRRRKTLWGAGMLLALFVLGGVIALTRPQDPFRGDLVRDTPFVSLTYSIQVFAWWDNGYVGYQLDSVQMLRFSHVKQTFAWRDMEPTRGAWTFHEADRILAETERRGLRLIARLGQVPDWTLASGRGSDDEKYDAPPQNLADWANYCRTVAARYRGRIVAYQIWNEPNLSREWGGNAPDADGYVRLLAACSTAIRAADPDALVISAGLAPTGTHDDEAHRDDIYFDAMYRAGFQQYVDVVGVHAMGFSPPEYGPDDAERDGIGRWFTFRRVEDLRKIMLRHDDGARQMAILEMGYTTDPINPDYAWFAVTEEQRAEYMVRAFEYIIAHWRPWVGLVNVIYMQNPFWTRANEQYWWSISTFDRYHLPAFMALARMRKVCGDVILPEGKENATEEEYLGNVHACP